MKITESVSIAFRIICKLLGKYYVTKINDNGVKCGITAVKP